MIIMLFLILVYIELNLFTVKASITYERKSKCNRSCPKTHITTD